MDKEPRVPTIEDFTFIKPISRGAFGKVFLGSKKGREEQLYAIKVMKKSDMINKNLTNQVVTERDAMAKVSSPFIVNLFYSIQSQQNIFLVMEYLIGGDVKSLLGVAGYFDEPMAIMYIAEVTLALEYLHSKRIIHRDLKPDNMLITDKGHIKLTDFGLSKFNFSFNTADQVPMTPKTPMPNVQNKYDLYRTPGQILSLRSSLAFSSDAESVYSSKKGTPLRPLSEVSMNSQDPNPSSPYQPRTQSNSIRTTPAHSPMNISIAVTPRLPAQRTMKQKSMRDLLLSQSTSKYLNTHGMPVSTPLEYENGEKLLEKKAPVSSLVNTLQASLNKTASVEGEETEISSVNISDMSSIGHVSRPLGMSLSCRDSLEAAGSIEYDESVMNHHIAEQYHNDDGCDNEDGCHGFTEHINSADGSFIVEDKNPGVDCSDSVFMSDVSNQKEIEEFQNYTKSSGSLKGKCYTCHKQTTRERNCSECESHLKVPSRQEKITDDTPQMHRTEESVWNSYAAKNLRSLRYGLYSEDSEGDSNKENTESVEMLEDEKDGIVGKNGVIGSVMLSKSLDVQNEKAFCDKTPKSVQHKPRKLTKMKCFSYPSDEEDSDQDLCRYKSRVQFAKKRSFCDVEQSPVRRMHSADSGLTQEFRLLRCNNGEPLSKRSHSLPRTRIRFHSGNTNVVEQEKSCVDNGEANKLPSVTAESSPDTKAELKSESVLCESSEGNVKDAQKCLEKISTKLRTLSDSDNLTTLSADEHRLVEGHSDTSASEQESVNTTDDLLVQNHSEISNTEVKSLESENVNKLRDGSTSVKSNNCNGSGNVECNVLPGQVYVNKKLAGLTKPLVSSLKSEGEERALSLNLSSINDDGEREMSAMDVSVFNCSGDSDMKPEDLYRSPLKLKEDNISLPPPPPPKSRRPSGKKTPAKITFASVATCIPPYVSNDSRSRSNSGRSDISMTPEPTRKDRVHFCTPNPKQCATPRTPFQRPCMRSQSFSCAMKTPYRTPKSVRRAPPPSEDDRILGTPDYLAPEILEQKPHGPGVDWWSLGICFFEFLTGVPPFNDQTPELVFQNILNRDIPWPEGEEALSDSCREAIEAILTMDPSHRPGARAIRRMSAFKDIDWQNLLDIEAPWVPQPDNNTDTSYFEARNMMQDLFVSDVDF